MTHAARPHGAPAVGRGGMLGALARHWPVYLMEAGGLAFFVIAASVVTTLLEHPDSPAHQAIGSTFGRRVVLGLAMGAVIAAIVYAPSGKRSGAHINPAVTWAFYWAGKIGAWDATFYTVAQFVGAVVGIQLVGLLIGTPFTHPAIDYAMTKPGPRGPFLAFVAEFVISFVLMYVVLVAVNSARLEKLTGLIAGALIAVYLAFETPLSGMSLNPARTFGSALAAWHWAELWLYFVAPTAAMLLAAELYLRAHPRVGGDATSQRGPTYPVEPTTLRTQ